MNKEGAWLRASAKLPILMAGMVGSKQAGYIKTPSKATQFSNRIVSVFNDKAQIIAEASTDKSLLGLPGVMRGEDVQVIGLSKINAKPNFFRFALELTVNMRIGKAVL